MCKQCSNVRPAGRPIPPLTNALQLWYDGKRGEAGEYIRALSRADLAYFVGFVATGRPSEVAIEIGVIVNA